MKSRKLRPVRAGGSKKKVPSDVSPSTGLPPLVEGELRCFLRVTVSRVLWTVHNPPSPTFVRLRWWGESSNGTHFFPKDASQLSQKTVKTTARFPVRCGPKQFTSYLTDMGSLVLEVLTKPDHLPIARAQVAGISRLSSTHPVSGFYTLVSPTSDKLGELQVSLHLEPLTESYDTSSSGPPTDISLEGLQVQTVTGPSQHVSAGSKKESARSSGTNTPRGKDHLYFQNAQKDKEETVENQTPTNNETSENPFSRNTSNEQSASNILSVILERGNKLRNAMVVSALKSDVDSDPALKDTPLPLQKDNIQPPLKIFPPPSGTFLENILQADSAVKQSDVAIVTDGGRDCDVDIDSRALDLLLGSSFTSPPPSCDGRHFLFDSLSDHNIVCVDSELSDPQYDESLLENLFYKAPISDHRSDEASPSSKNHQLWQSGSKTMKNPHLDQPHSADVGGLRGLLDEEQMVLLSSARRLRVTIDSLTVPAGSSIPVPRKTGRPPQPLTKKCTYSVEYQSPEASGRRGRSGEATRVVSSRVSKGVVKFEQTSVFSVHLDAAAVQHWWKTDLNFKIYSRKVDQKKAVSVGKAVHPLRCLLQNRQLRQSLVLPVQTSGRHIDSQEIGPLKVTVELETDGRSFLSERSKTQVTGEDLPPPHAAFSPQREARSQPQHADPGREESWDHSAMPHLNVRTPQKPSKDSVPHPGPFTSLKTWQQQQEEEEEPQVLLHVLLMIPDGKNFSRGPLQAPNVYLNCKLFWCDETARSVVSWGQKNPTFNFVQVSPVALTSKLLEQMKNNMMPIEVWQKTGLSGQDQLLGLVKLPLHQFYMSFRDLKIARLLLQAQYPVLAVDCYLPVSDVFSGSCRGSLRVVLAMGQAEQIVSLQRSRDEEWDLPPPVRPVHLLDQQRHSQQKAQSGRVEAMREHVFLVRVEKVSGLTPLQSTVWGEADCYVQYSFPCQDGGTAAELDHNLIECSVNLKPFRTTTTLCVPDPLFGHAETHVLVTPEDVPVQRLLLSSLSSQGLSSGGGVQFDVWCRYYYPNVRDQLVARGMLPLSKLCAMVTMQRQQPNEDQRFSLPLIPRTDGPSSHHHHPSGLLDVCVRYKHRPLRREVRPGRGAASRIVTLVVQVHRASGLQAAARLLAEKDQRFEYFAGVGLNPYVSVQFSFLPESETRCTRTAARTFSPEFDHHAEVACDLLAQRSGGETCSLAEQLDQASAVFTVWNKENRKALNVSKDVMLGTVRIPLAHLIHKRTGISGWFGVYFTPEAGSSQHQPVLVGGLELSVNFSHHSDRERVIKAAQGLAWDTNHTESPPHDDDCEESVKKISLSFSMPRAWIPVHCLLLPGHGQVQRSTYCYFRYKFYDQEAFCSPMRHPRLEEGDQATVSFEGSRTVELASTQPLAWYLREERLEVQVWVAFMKDKKRRPSDTDRLVGSAFVDLSSFGTTGEQKLSLSGVYPLFRRSAADLQGAALRVHITLTTSSEHREEPAGVGAVSFSDSEDELSLEEAEAADEAASQATPRKSLSQSGPSNQTSRETADATSLQRSETSMDESFPVTVTVDRAMHLNLRGCPLAERSEGSPCCCVSYLTADSAEPVSTAVIEGSSSPVWDHQHECRLSKQLLVDPQQSLVFKVWHKGEMERVMGFAPVDLSPLLCGFPSVCGWYNITDFSGQCHGQLKVSVTPLRGVQDLRERRRTISEEAARDSSSAFFQSVPLSYQTTATYSSFPSHISRYPEQQISSPDHTDRLFSQSENRRTSSESDRHLEHMDKVRLYHQSLQERAGSLSPHVNPCSSVLFSALRKKLGELDNIQRYFGRKLSTPTFPSVAEQEERSDPHTDASQLLLKSTQLVGEVDNIISGLRGTHLEPIPSCTQSGSLTSEGDDNLQTVIEGISRPRRLSDDLPEASSPVCSPPPGSPDHQADSEPEEGKGETSEEDGGGSSENDEDYEEVVVEPRSLNEVTSLTDRTSPWTSVLSDPDLVSLESLEAPGGPNLSEDEEDEGRTAEVDDGRPGDERGCESPEGSLNGAGTEGERTLQTLDEELPEEACPSPSTQQVTDTHNATGSLDNQDAERQHSVPPELPNFFLSSQQLEASMRAIRLAPSFSRPFSDPGPLSSGGRAPRPRPDMSPSSLKRETERIAKIFAARFDQSPEDVTL